MNVRAEAVRLAALAAIANEVKAAQGQTKKLLMHEMVEGGSRTIDAEIGDEHVGTISRVRARPVPFIADEASFVTWCETHAPTEIRQTVAPSYQKAYLDRLEYVDRVGWVDPETGEQPEFVGVTTKDAYLRVTQTDDDRTRLLNAIQADTLTFAEVLALDE